jgi:PST family polysaccharide transporter
MANIFVGLVLALSEFGIGATIVNVRELGDREVAQINTVSVMFGFVGFLLSCLCAIPLGWFFHNDRLPSVVAALGTTFAITSFKTVPAALLQRSHRFRDIAKVDAVSSLAYAGCSIAGALLGWQYWSLVAGSLAWLTVQTMLTLRLVRTRFLWPDLRALRYPLRFGRHIVTADISWYLYTNADFLAAGKMLGSSALGSYSIAWTIANAPIEKITSVVMRVLPAFFAASFADREALRSYLYTLYEVLALITFPMAALLALLAEPLILAVLGPKWSAAVLPLRILAGFIAVRALTNVLMPLLNAQRQTKFTMWTNVAAAVYFPIGFFFGSRWGAPGIAAVWVVLFPVLAIPLFWRAQHEIGLQAGRIAGALWPAASSVAYMVAALIVVGYVLPAGLSVYSRLGVQLAAAGAVYVLVLFTVHVEAMRSLFRTVRPLAS